MVTLSRVTIDGNPRFPSMVTLSRVTIYGNLFIFRIKRDRGLFHGGGLELPSFFPFRCVNGFYLGHELSFFFFRCICTCLKILLTNNFIFIYIFYIYKQKLIIYTYINPTIYICMHVQVYINNKTTLNNKFGFFFFFRLGEK
jgi:hypothetical protein